jgi:hypothetical protein
MIAWWDVMEELVKFTLLVREHPELVQRYSERKEDAQSLSDRVKSTVDLNAGKRVCFAAPDATEPTP